MASKWLSIAAVACVVCMGCANRPKLISTPPPTTMQSESGIQAAELQQALTAFVDRFMPAVAEACDYIESNVTSPEARASAKARKIGAAMAAMKNAVNPNPYAGLLDMAVMVTLLRDVADTPAAKKLYGPYGQRFAATMELQKSEIWALAAQFVTEAQLQELQQSIATWRASHPNSEYVAFVRMSDFPETKQLKSEQVSAKRPNSVFGLLFLDPLSNLDPAVREFGRSRQLAERAFFYLQRMSIVMAWQIDLTYAQMMAAPEVQTTIKSAAAFSGSTTRFADASQDFAATAARFQEGLGQWQRDAVRDLEKAVERQRTDAIQQATTSLAAERDAAVKQVAAALHAEQRDTTAGFDAAMQHAIETMYRRMLIILGVVFALVLSGVMVIRRTRRRQREMNGEAISQRATC
jgi:hypothetical protein